MRGRNRGITIYGTQKRISTMRVCTQTWAIAARDKLGVKTAISGGDRAARRPARRRQCCQPTRICDAHFEEI